MKEVFMHEIIKEKIEHIQALISKMENNGRITLVDILKEEIDKLKSLNTEYKKMLSSKSVVHKTSHKNRTRYHLKDGSTYVINHDKTYKYLFDASTKTITYEFANGQIEKTFPCGVKEIRHPDGSITVKHDNKEYDFIQEKRE